MSYDKKMLKMWADRYIKIAQEKGSPLARKWAKGFIPEEAIPQVKIFVEERLRIKR